MSKYLKVVSLILACAVLIGGGATFAIAGKGGKTTGSASKSQYTPKPGDQGCTPGYWKQVHPNSWVTYSPNDSFNTVFGVNYNPKLTLLGALNDNGGGFSALARHAAAALLNSSNPNVNYGLTSSQIIAMVQKAFASGEPEQIKDEFAAFNEVGCSIDAHGSPK
jgi:hypothetical protein